MANQLPMSYLISIDGVTIVNHTALCATDVARDTTAVNVPSYILPTQVKLPYNAGDSPVTPGMVTQAIVAKSGGIALYNSLRLKQGHYVTTIASEHDGGANITCEETFVISVDDTTPGLKRDGDIHISITIEVFGDWT